MTTIILCIVAYMLLSVIIGCSKFEKYLKYLYEMLSMPEGDIELHNIKEPKIITPITLLFLPSLVVFIMCEENYYR